MWIGASVFRKTSRWCIKLSSGSDPGCVCTVTHSHTQLTHQLNRQKHLSVANLASLSQDTGKEIPPVHHFHWQEEKEKEKEKITRIVRSGPGWRLCWPPVNFPHRVSVSHCFALAHLVWQVHFTKTLINLSAHLCSLFLSPVWLLSS